MNKFFEILVGLAIFTIVAEAMIHYLVWSF